MIDYAIQKGVITKRNTSDAAQKGRFYFIGKLFRDYLNKFNVGFSDPCCPSSNLSAPVRYNSGLQYYNGSTWVGATASGGQLAGFYPTAVQQALSGAGAINVTSYYTAWTTTGAQAGTLADGTQIGQLKSIKMVVDGGDGTLTPAHLSGGTTITFNDVSDYVKLIWNGTAWVVLENFGTTIA